MSNLAYCKFQNTLADLRDCYEALDEGKKLSADEEKARDLLINLCRDIVNDFGDWK